MSRKLLARVAAAVALTLVAAAPAHAHFGSKANTKNTTTPDLPTCASPIGTVAIQEPQRAWWTELGLNSPESLIKLMAGRSNCLRVVDRNGGLAMRNTEAALANSGDLQRGSNVGAGQIARRRLLHHPRHRQLELELGRQGARRHRRRSSAAGSPAPWAAHRRRPLDQELRGPDHPHPRQRPHHRAGVRGRGRGQEDRHLLRRRRRRLRLRAASRRRPAAATPTPTSAR